MNSICNCNVMRAVPNGESERPSPNQRTNARYSLPHIVRKWCGILVRVRVFVCSTLNIREDLCANASLCTSGVYVWMFLYIPYDILYQSKMCTSTINSLFRTKRGCFVHWGGRKSNGYEWEIGPTSSVGPFIDSFGVNRIVLGHSSQRVHLSILIE